MFSMNKLPDLATLSHAEKDDLIRALFAQVTALLAKVDALTSEVADLKGRLAKNSQNSSKPPSSDGYHKPNPKSERPTGQNPLGGQKGHAGRTLKKVAQPDYVEAHLPERERCRVCQRTLPEPVLSETRPVFDIPVPAHAVTEHRLYTSVCACGQAHRGHFPADVTAPVQYGQNIKAVVVELLHQQRLPVARTGALMGDLYGLPLSEASVIAFSQEAAERLQPLYASIAQAVTASPVVHADETGMRVAGRLNGLHGAVTEALSFLGIHANCGSKAFADIGILPDFRGALIHDGLAAYRDLDCTHGLCNAHPLRELTYAAEELDPPWAKKLHDLRVSACHEVNASGGILSDDRRVFYRWVYAFLLLEGEADNPEQPATGKRGRTPQTKAFNLLRRLRLFAEDVWRFATDRNVPFTNNLAEQAVRMPKVKQKISGGFRTLEGIQDFCVIRTCLASLQKQKRGLFEALVLVFQGGTLSLNPA